MPPEIFELMAESKVNFNKLTRTDRKLIEAFTISVFEYSSFKSGIRFQKKFLEEKSDMGISLRYSQKLLEMFLRKRKFQEASRWLSSLPSNVPSVLNTYFSIIMITKNRGDRIRGTLKALKSIAFPASRFEIIVVDNGSTDNTSMIVKEELSDALCKMRYIVHPTGRICAARNAGIDVVDGDWVGFIDDDAICQPDWLLQYLFGLLSVPDAVGMGGPVELPSEYLKPKWWRSRHSGLLSCKKGHSEISPVKILDNPYGLNMWFKRSIFDRVGNFDERMDTWCHPFADETELFIRIQREGFIVIFVPNAKVIHYVHPDRLNYINIIRRAFQIGRSQKTLDWLYSGDIRIGVSLLIHLKRCLRGDLLGPFFIALPIELSLWFGYKYQKRHL